MRHLLLSIVLSLFLVQAGLPAAQKGAVHRNDEVTPNLGGEGLPVAEWRKGVKGLLMAPKLRVMRVWPTKGGGLLECRRSGTQGADAPSVLWLEADVAMLRAVFGGKAWKGGDLLGTGHLIEVLEVSSGTLSLKGQSGIAGAKVFVVKAKLLKYNR
jgi:hypothetical protein